MKISAINLQNYRKNPNINFTGTSNAIAKSVDTICESKVFTKKHTYSALGVLIIGALGYLVLKPDNEAIKHASRYTTKN